MFQYINATMVQALRWISTFRLTSGDLTIIVCISKSLRVLLSFFINNMVLRCWPFGRLVLRGEVELMVACISDLATSPTWKTVIKLKDTNASKGGTYTADFGCSWGKQIFPRWSTHLFLLRITWIPNGWQTSSVDHGMPSSTNQRWDGKNSRW